MTECIGIDDIVTRDRNSVVCGHCLDRKCSRYHLARFDAWGHLVTQYDVALSEDLDDLSLAGFLKDVPIAYGEKRIDGFKQSRFSLWSLGPGKASLLGTKISHTPPSAAEMTSLRLEWPIHETEAPLKEDDE